jgi:hypothetical protein
VQEVAADRRERATERLERTTRRELRLDLIIAVSALLISAIAATTSVMQTRVFANQLSAAVWPYVSFSFTTGDKMVKYTLNNDGLGPAIIRSAKLTVDDKPKNTITQAFRLVQHETHHYSISTSSLGAGSVIRPSAGVTVIDYTGPDGRALSAAMRARVKVTICYCSLLDQCWTIATSTSFAAPAQVRDCGKPTSVDA